ncbi:MAG: helix-turn-helix domain-containing protein [Planctomycetaceae bacterium]|nr:helix-turn-helix domain-containing protein [Planctomycetaceae bacterium]
MTTGLIQPPIGPPLPQLLYPVADAAQILGISRAKLYRLISDCKIGSTRIGRSRRICKYEIERIAREGC